MIWDVHPGSGFFSIPDLGIKNAPDPGSGSATLRITLEFQGNIGAQENYRTA
jgi:hypothetical protein